MQGLRVGLSPVLPVCRAGLAGAATPAACLACDTPACWAVDDRPVALAARLPATARRRAKEAAARFLVRPILAVLRAPVPGMTAGAAA